MTMTPQMQESIKILQLASIDLLPYVNQQIEENPFLERSESAVESDKTVEESTETDSARDEVLNENLEENNSWSDDEISPAIYENESSIYEGVGRGASSNFSDSNYSVEDLSTRPETLRNHVIDQINIEFSDSINRMVAFHLADLMDENGYISHDLSSVVESLKCDYEQVGDVLTRLQALDPAGVFARDLEECLALQLSDKNHLDPAMKKLLNNLDLFAKRDFKKLCQICAVDEEDMVDMCEEIKALNPKPGNVFSFEEVQVIQPDIYLKKNEKGEWNIELNSQTLPKALVNRRYYAKIEGKVKDKASKKFLSEQFQTANWLVRALDQRANTVLKVATEIIIQQNEFFLRGIHHLKPMVLSDIAEAIEMHESTVSRVINGKYLATHMGMFELKYFFSSSVSSKDGGEDVSSRRIKFMIKEMVEKEDVKSILSDDKISALLKEQSIDVARRTVMKYRESMKIPSSVQRRREKKTT